MKVATFVVCVAVFLASCGPCGMVVNERMCKAAYFNMPRLAKVQVGMTTEEVQQIMEKPPQRREADAGSETWYFIGDYDAEMMTAVRFESGRVSSLKQVKYEEPE